MVCYLCDNNNGTHSCRIQYIKRGTLEKLPSNGKQKCWFFQQDGSIAPTASNSIIVVSNVMGFNSNLSVLACLFIWADAMWLICAEFWMTTHTKTQHTKMTKLQKPPETQYRQFIRNNFEVINNLFPKMSGMSESWRGYFYICFNTLQVM